MNCHSCSLSSTLSFPTKSPPFQKAKGSQHGIKVDRTSAGHWVHACFEENNMGPKWWREFQCLLQHPSDFPIQKTGPPTSHGLPATYHTAEGRWLVDHPTLSGSTGAEEIPSPKGFPEKLQLLGSKEGRDSHPGCGSLDLCRLIGNTPRSTIWISAWAPPMSCPPPWRRWSPECGGVGCCEGSHDSCSCFSYSRGWRGETDPIGTWGACTSEPEEAPHSMGGLDLIWGRFPARPLGFVHSQANWTNAALARGIPLGHN